MKKNNEHQPERSGMSIRNKLSILLPIIVTGFLIGEHAYNGGIKNQKFNEFTEQYANRSDVLSYQNNEKIIDSLSKENQKILVKTRDSITLESSIMQKIGIKVIGILSEKK